MFSLTGRSIYLLFGHINGNIYTDIDTYLTE